MGAGSLFRPQRQHADHEPYAIWGLKVGYDADLSLSLHVEGRNLGDVHYIASTGITNIADPALTNLFEPGSGRAIYAERNTNGESQ